MDPELPPGLAGILERLKGAGNWLGTNTLGRALALGTMDPRAQETQDAYDSALGVAADFMPGTGDVKALAFDAPTLFAEGHPVWGTVAAASAIPFLGLPFDVARKMGPAVRQMDDGRQMVTLRHYGRGANEDVLEVAKQGTGQPGTELANPDRLPRTYFYGPGVQPEVQFRGQPFVDVDVDVSKFAGGEAFSEAMEQARVALRAEKAAGPNPNINPEPTPAAVQNRAEQMLREQGAEGIFDENRGGGGYYAKFTDTPLVSRQVADHYADPQNPGSTFFGGRNAMGQDTHSVAVFEGDDMVRPGPYTEAMHEEFTTKFADELAKPDRGVGTWERDGEIVMDVVEKVDDREEALRLSAERGQDGIFHLGGDGYIETPKPEAPAVLSGSEGPLFDLTPEGLSRGFIDGVSQSPIEYARVAKSDRVQTLRSRFTPERRRGLISLADEIRSAVPAAQYWYATDPLRERFIAELGAGEGADAFNMFMRRVAATSPRTAVMKNIIYASRNQPVMRTMGGLLHRANTLEPFGVGAPKVSSFYENLVGNMRPPTIDVHMTNVLAGPNVRRDIPPVPNIYGEYDRLFANMAEEAGWEVGQLQSTLWHAGPTLVDPAPFLQMVDRAVGRSAARLEIPKEEALRRFIRGEEALGGLVVGMVGKEVAEYQSNEEERRRAPATSLLGVPTASDRLRGR